MAHFWIAGYMPDNYVPSPEDEAMGEKIHALNKEMVAAGVRVYACGMYPASMAKTVSSTPDGGALITDGPYLEAKEHIGGFWIIDAPDMDQALAWARKGIVATRGRGEVRELFFMPAPE